MMELSLHRDLADIPAEAWNELATLGISDTPFARFEYLQQWWETRGGGEWKDGELALIAAREGDRLTGLAPFFKSKHDGRPALLFLGSIEISDYLDFIVRREHAAPFIRAVLQVLRETETLAGIPLDLYNLPQSSPSLGTLRAEAERMGWSYREEGFRDAPVIELQSDFEEYLARLPKKQRHEIRRKLRRAGEGADGAVFELLRDPDEIAGGIEDFLDLMAHDEEKRRFLSPPMRSHMSSLMRVAGKAGYLWLAFLNIGGTRAAAAFNYDYGNRLWAYNSAVNREFLGLSPGWVLLAHQIRWACEQGRAEFDFLRGGEDYKYRFGAINRRVMRAVVEPSGPRP